MFQSNKRNMSEAFIFEFLINKPNWKAGYLQFIYHTVFTTLSLPSVTIHH